MQSSLIGWANCEPIVSQKKVDEHWERQRSTRLASIAFWFDISYEEFGTRDSSLSSYAIWYVIAMRDTNVFISCALNRTNKTKSASNLLN